MLIGAPKNSFSRNGSLRPLLMAITLLSITACAPMPEKAMDHDVRLTVNQYYQMGHAQLAQQQVADAAKTVDRMELIYPLHAETSRLQLELIEGYYESSLMDQTVASAERFITMFPGHKDVDYAHYLRGLANFARGVTALSQMNANPDSTYARDSLASFTQMLERFPRSQHAATARHYANYLQSQLDSYEYRLSGVVPARMAEAPAQEALAKKPVAAIEKVTIKSAEPEPAPEKSPTEPAVIPPVVAAPAVSTVAARIPTPAHQANEIFYIIQVAAFNDLEGVKKEIAKLGLSNAVRYYTREVKGKRVYAALYGHYPNAAAARAAMVELQVRTGLGDLWLRQRFSFESEVESVAAR